MAIHNGSKFFVKSDGRQVIIEILAVQEPINHIESWFGHIIWHHMARTEDLQEGQIAS